MQNELTKRFKTVHICVRDKFDTLTFRLFCEFDANLKNDFVAVF